MSNGEHVPGVSAELYHIDVPGFPFGVGGSCREIPVLKIDSDRVDHTCKYKYVT
jgi:hypothetical protein